MKTDEHILIYASFGSLPMKKRVLDEETHHATHVSRCASKEVISLDEPSRCSYGAGARSVFRSLFGLHFRISLLCLRLLKQKSLKLYTIKVSLSLFHLTFFELLFSSR